MWLFLGLITNIAVSVQVLNEVAIILIKKADFSEEEIRTLIDSLYQFYTIAPLNRETLFGASHLLGQLNHCQCAAEQCRSVYSEDMQHEGMIEQKRRIVNPIK